MAKASVLTIRIPAELKKRIANLAEEQGVSINQLAMYMFTKEVGDLEARQHLSKYWKTHTKEKIYADFDMVMSKVMERPVPDWDKME